MEQMQYKSPRKWSGHVVKANETVANSIWQGKVEGKHQEEASKTVVLENVRGWDWLRYEGTEPEDDVACW